MDSLASATLLKADGSTVEATTALQGKVQLVFDSNVFLLLNLSLFYYVFIDEVFLLVI